MCFSGIRGRVRWQRSSIALLANGSEYVYVRPVKAYQQKKGTTTDKCVASAESDVFIQAVALLYAVIPQTARRCHLLVGWLLRAAAIAFTTRLWANQTRAWFEKDTSWDCKTRNVVHMFLKTSCQSLIDPQCFHEYVCLVSLQADSREWLSLA